MVSKFSIIVETPFGDFKDGKFKTLFERYLEYDTSFKMNLTDVIDSLHLLFSNVNHRIVIKFDSYEVQK